jgi:hypothetical protein
MLVDLAKHVANAYEQQEGRSNSDSLQRIRAGFDAEWSKATDHPAGHIMKPDEMANDPTPKHPME